MKPPDISRTGPAGSAVAMLLALLTLPLMCPGEGASRFQTETSEILLIGKMSKWEEVQLRRTTWFDGTVAYRWEFHQGGRDRRGQGSFTASAECLLNVYAKIGTEADTKQVEVIAEGPDGLALRFSFADEGEDTAELHIVASRVGDSVSVTFKAKGQLPDEFVERMETLGTQTDREEAGFIWSIPLDWSDPEGE